MIRYITSKVNSGELIISYVLFAKNRSKYPQQHPHVSLLSGSKQRENGTPSSFCRFPETGGYAP